jgi:hypothetical protein
MNLHNRRNHLNIPRKNNRSSHGTGWDMCYGYTHLIRFPSTIWTLVMLSGFFIALLSGRKYFITSVIVSGFPRCFSVGAVWKELVL